MSSSAAREPLSGIIRQDKKIIGAICLPEDEVLEFVEQFNHCYGPLGLHIDPPLSPLPAASGLVVPVGGSFRKPFKIPTSRN